mmetsp:Transcript_50963/g.136824  ORF Transcript_50963/g.136824 Transcript_50963/m.136824 type:complete len:208 (-) Transcript_50963:102-725(-)
MRLSNSIQSAARIGRRPFEVHVCLLGALLRAPGNRSCRMKPFEHAARGAPAVLDVVRGGVGREVEAELVVSAGNRPGRLKAVLAVGVRDGVTHSVEESAGVQDLAVAGACLVLLRTPISPRAHGDVPVAEEDGAVDLGRGVCGAGVRVAEAAARAPGVLLDARNAGSHHLALGRTPSVGLLPRFSLDKVAFLVGDAERRTDDQEHAD